MILRDLRVVRLSFQPVHYNPASQTLKVTRRMQVEVEFTDGDPENVQRRRRSTIPPSFDQLYRDIVVNYSGPDAGQTMTPGTYLMICQNNATVLNLVQPLLDWRQRQGFSTILAHTGQTGTSTSSIKAYIQSIYNDPAIDLEYVALVGDHNALPTWFENLSGYSGEGDHPYTQLEGGDVLSDVHLGRLSYSTTLELERIVNKILFYETDPWMTNDPGWFTRAALVGDPGASGWSTVFSNQWVKSRLLDIGYTEVDTVWSNFSTAMATAFNRGDTFLGYRGWLNMSGWSNGDTYSMQNGRKMPFAVIITCGTGSFASGTSLSEGFLRSGSGTTTVNGGIGAIGTATIGTHTRYNNCFYYGVWRGLLWEEPVTMGAALTRGKMELYLNYQQVEPNKGTIWSYWNNLMGGPAVDIYTSYPEPPVVDHPASIAFGANAVAVTVTDGVSPVEGAQVCLSKGAEVHVVGYTDAQGEVDLPIKTTTTGDMHVTVTKHNGYPYLATVPVATEEVFVGYLGSVIDDDMSGGSTGNGDGLLNPGETVELRVQLQNFGTSAAGNVVATLTTGEPMVQILDDTETYGTILGGATAWSPDDFDIEIDPAYPDGQVIQLGLDVTSLSGQWHSLIELTPVAADLAAGTITLYNSGNGRLDPGEELEMSVLLTNGGGATATNVVGTLISLSPFVSVTDATGTYGTVGIGGSSENTSDHFRISAAASTYQGHLANFLLATEFSGGITDTTELALTVGLRGSTDPVGPDRYGYYAFDNTDVGYPDAPTYNWIELDPAYGGDGTEVVLGDFGDYQDKSLIVDLPFPFQYYGQTYSRATICSNGWIAMGETYLTLYRNWTIPGAGGPNAMLAVFWDDLKQVGGAAVYQKYDAANHRWIVEWSRLRNDPGSTETVEAILYDPAFHSTGSGDGIIVYQYHTVTNNETPDGYATVGIESPDQSDGLLYTYYNRYPQGAATLAAGRAIKFLPLDSRPLGTLEGLVLNSSAGNSPIEGAEVEILGQGRSLMTVTNGFYSGLIPVGTHDIAARHPSFRPDTAYAVVINEGQATELDFYLADIAPPQITTTTRSR
jgi:hypothetical protein